MYRRTPSEARLLGLWTAGWLFAFLLAGVLRLGDLSLQWPVLLLPLLWAGLALLRGRRGRVRRAGRVADPEDWHPVDRDRQPIDRTPPTREVPWLPDVPGGRRDE